MPMKWVKNLSINFFSAPSTLPQCENRLIFWHSNELRKYFTVKSFCKSIWSINFFVRFLLLNIWLSKTFLFAEFNCIRSVNWKKNAILSSQLREALFKRIAWMKIFRRPHSIVLMSISFNYWIFLNLIHVGYILDRSSNWWCVLAWLFLLTIK